MKYLISNKGGEFISEGFVEYYEKYGIKRQFSATRTPQQNSVMERKNRIMQDMDRKSMIENKV